MAIEGSLPFLQLNSETFSVVHSVLAVHIGDIERELVFLGINMVELDIVGADLIHQVTTLGNHTSAYSWRTKRRWWRRWRRKVHSSGFTLFRFIVLLLLLNKINLMS